MKAWKEVWKEFKKLIADHLIWWAFRLDPERFIDKNK